MTPEQKAQLEHLITEILAYTAPEALAWKLKVRLVEFIEDLLEEAAESPEERE